ncbi:MAG: protein-L-isoaspartate(D-aspartate) O-methyltransferase [Gemmatimonadaceae bacterium]|nr:protein-L-isoaspartate(D-aspartate) O-methyltransferase [Gemmatimonadaceae bacterium]
MTSGPDLRGPRRRLIEALSAQGIRDLAVLAAFDAVPRHRFVPTGVRHRAYEDAPLPIGAGQTISQPYVHALYLQLLGLRGTERVLEIGTGSGFQTALLARLAAQVFTVERVRSLHDTARRQLEELGVRNVSYLCGDGTIGWREYGPYDAILVGAGAPSLPTPLVDQLAVGGRLLVPVGDREKQVLRLVIRTPTGTTQETVADMRFVPLVGSHGWLTAEGDA